MKRSSRHFVRSVLGIALLASSSGALAQQPGDPRQGDFATREQVTAVDLVVEVQGDVGPLEPRRLGARFDAGDFTVAEDGVPRQVVAVESPGPQAEPARLVLYFDLPLAGPRGVRWAARALGERAAELVGLGEVELVVADPEPRIALAAGRDAEQLANALARLDLHPGGGEELVALRREVLKQAAELDPAAAAELARAAAAEEGRFVRRHQDALLLHLVDAATRPGVGPRRSVLLVGSGWDLDPWAFYRQAGVGEGAAPPAASDLATAASDLAATLSAYGWTVLALPPPEIERKPWHLRRRIEVWLDGNRDPKKAEAYIELAGELEESADLEQAVEAYEKAIYHFYDHPKSAARQALATARLAAVLDRLGRFDEAGEAYARAAELDPGVGARHPGAAAALAEPLAPLAILAKTTAGRLARGDEALASAIASLGRRVRLTYQVGGPPAGGLRPLAVELHRLGLALRAPGFSRSGTPGSVAAARLRRLLDDGAVTGTTLPVSATWITGGVWGGTLRVSLDQGMLADPGRRVLLRLSLATGGPDDDPEVPPASVRHLDPVDVELAAGGPWIADLTIDSPAGHTSVAVLVEDLIRGDWGAALAEEAEPVAASPARR